MSSATSGSATGEAPTEASTARVVFNPLADGFFDDPYQQYARLRELDPVHRSPMGLVCFAYDDIWRVLRLGGTTVCPANVPGPGGEARPPAPLFPRALLNLDPPDHPRVRQLMARMFTPRRIGALSEWISLEVDRILDDLEVRWEETGEPIDIATELAFPLPFKVISDILGMPETDDDQVREWAQAITEASLAMTADGIAAATTAYHALSDYLVGDVLPWKRDHRGDDVLSALLEAERDESATRQEVLDQVALLYVAGHETTSGLIGNGVLNLLRHRAELERVQRDPELMPAAIEELNRYDSAIQFTWRYALDPIEVGDQIVEPGEMVLLSLGSANRDATKFGPDADVLDLERASAREALSFGAGMHFCLGAALARREGALAIGSLVTRFPRLALAAPPVRNPRVTFRALHSLHVALAA